MSKNTTHPLPTMGPQNAGYFNGLAQGELRLQRCEDCVHRWFPPSPHCPECLSADWTWAPAAGTGKVWSWVVMHRAYFSDFPEETPYQVAVIKLDEGPLMVSKVVDVSADGLVCDQPVTADVLRVDADTWLPVFRARPT